jgi:DNA-binding PadR family transcriptional regulator
MLAGEVVRSASGRSISTSTSTTARDGEAGAVAVAATESGCSRAAIADEPRHGYELIKAVEDMTGGEYAPSPGVVYPTLTMLEDMGLIAEKKSKDSKKVYEATDEGRAHLEENSEEVEELIERLEGHGHHRRRGQRPEIGRAIGNLMTALRNRIAHEGWNEQLLDDVVDILDEAAQRVERVRDAKPEDPDDD